MTQEIKKLPFDLYNIYYNDELACTMWCKEHEKQAFIDEFDDPTKVRMVKWTDDEKLPPSYRAAI